MEAAHFLHERLPTVEEIKWLFLFCSVKLVFLSGSKVFLK